MRSKRSHAPVKKTKVVREKRGNVSDKMNARGFHGGEDGFYLSVDKSL